MGWIDSIDHGVFTITTGDGRTFTPMLKITETSKEFNATAFDFINKEGSLIDRRKVKARKFPLLFYFQGDDNIAQADAFDKSANDSRPWRVNHPLYGTIIGQPLSLSRNDSYFNSTEISVDFWETITDVIPVQQISPVDVVTAKTANLKAIAAIEYANKVVLKPADVGTVKSLSEKINQVILKSIDATGYNDFMSIKNDVAVKADNLIASPVEAMNSLFDLVGFPASLQLSVDARSNMVMAIYQNAKDLLKKLTPNNKALFENNAAAAVAAMANIILTPQDGDYVTRNDYELQVDKLTDMYNDYQSTLDLIYVPDVDFSKKYAAGVQTQTGLKSIIITTIGNMAVLAFAAKQERRVIVPTNTNLILLTHQYMGLDIEDVNLEQFRAINNIKNKKLFTVKKGTVIKYYV